MKIGELAHKAGVTTKTVRYYESIGLMAEPARTSSGYRDYGDDAAERLRFIRDSQAAGLSLAEVGGIFAMKDAGESTCSHTAALLDRHLADVDRQIERLLAAKAELLAMSKRAGGMDPGACSDPQRCQVIEAGRADAAVQSAHAPGPSKAFAVHAHH